MAEKFSKLEVLAIGGASFIMGAINGAISNLTGFDASHPIYAGGICGAIVAANHYHKTGKYFENLYSLDNGKRAIFSGMAYGIGYLISKTTIEFFKK